MVTVDHIKLPTFHTIPSMKDSAYKKINHKTNHLHTELITSSDLQKQLTYQGTHLQNLRFAQ
jgi:hypothetical protein